MAERKAFSHFATPYHLIHMAGKLLSSCRKISAVLLDITGVLYNSGEGGGDVIAGSPAAVER